MYPLVLASLVLSGRDWIVWVLPAVLVLSFLALRGYRGVDWLGGWKGVAMGCKLAGIALVGLCLLEPLWIRERARPGSNYFAVLVDNGAGLTVRDPGASRTRAEMLGEHLTGGERDWQDRLLADFQLRRYRFDARVEPSTDFSDVRWDGQASGLIGALSDVARRYQGQPLAGILVFTDGIATDLPEGGLNLAGLPPVYPVMLGEERPLRDVSMETVSVSQTAFEDAPITLQAAVQMGDVEGRSIRAQVVATNGQVVAEQVQSTKGADGRLSFRFQVRPAPGGLAVYEVRAGIDGEVGRTNWTESTAEATLSNNRRVVVVDRGAGPYRILYVAGRPNWEYKFLNRALEDDPELQLVGLIRVARREPKFEFRGRQGESSNPLFRGFDKKTEDTERYDQPVLKRLNVRDASELAAGFPKTPESLFAYHAVILDDVESEFFTADQLLLLQRFVSERGGGFLMLGGQEMFREGRYDRTPIADILPVYLDRPGSGKLTADWRIELTREGWLQPWLRLRATEAEETARLSGLPGFHVLNQVAAVKPGAGVLAVLSDSQGERHPALAAQRFGAGKSAALLIGDLWRSGLRSEQAAKDLAKTWRQLARWLVVDVPGPVSIRAEPDLAAGPDARKIRVEVRDRQFRPLEGAAVRVEIREVGREVGSTNVVRLSAEASGGDPGRYETEFVARRPGGYAASVVALDETGSDLGHATTGWATDSAAEEFRSLKPDRALLERIAKDTGGQMAALTKLDDLVASLPLKKAPITEAWSDPIWHRWWVLLPAICLLAIEWGIRRWKGLA